MRVELPRQTRLAATITHLTTMKVILKRLKLIDNLTTDLEISRTEFVEKLSAITDKGDIGLFSDTFDVFSSSKNELKGQVDFNGFKLKRRRKFFDNGMNMAVASGTIKEHNGHLTIESEINGVSIFFIVFYFFLVIFYSLFIFSIWNSNNNTEFFALPFLLLHGTLMFSIPYFTAKRSVKRLKYELEREFFYLTKQK